LIRSASQLRAVAVFGLFSFTTLAAGGCMRSVEIPRNDVQASHQWHGYYQIKTTHDQYTVKEFATTDSTLVIAALSNADRKYGRIDLPLSVRWDDVQSVSRQEVNAPKTVLIVGGTLVVAIGALVALIVLGENDSY
jgi:hypothetical protein